MSSLTVSAAQSQQNVRDARLAVGRSLGFFDGGPDGSRMDSLSQANLVRLTDALAAHIVAHPDDFDDNALAVARRRVGHPMYAQPMADTSFDGGAFLDALADEASVTFPSIGNKVLVAATVVAVVFVAIAALRLFPKKAAA